MTGDELSEALKQSRVQMEAALAGLTDEQMVEPGVLDDWSVKDLLSHLIAWEAEMVTALARAKWGQTPKLPARTDAEVNAVNAQWYKENKKRPLERVRVDFHGVRKQTLRQVEGLSDSQLADTRPWLTSGSLVEFIAGESFEHEAEHAAQILEWRRQKFGA